MISELYEERERLEQAIAALEQVASKGGRRRGRPPKWLTQARKRAEQQGEPAKPPGS